MEFRFSLSENKEGKVSLSGKRFAVFSILLISFTILHVAKFSAQETQQNLTPKNEVILARSVIDILKANIPKIMEKDSIPGVSVAVVNDKKILWFSSYGFTDKTKKRQITDETLFSIQSMSKNFTALAVLMAVQDGLLDLDTPIKRYLPKFTVHSPYDEQPQDKITLRHLLSHRAGFTHEAPVGNNFEDRPHPFQEHIESTSDMSRIKKNRKRAIGHLSDGNSPPVYIPMIPAGGLYTNGVEMANFLRFHINSGVYEGQRLIKKNILDQMYSVAFPLLNQEFGYGFCLWKEMIGNTYQYYHAGAGYRFTSGMVIYPELKLGVVILTNSENHGLDLPSVRMMIEPTIRSLYGEEKSVPISITEQESGTLPIHHPRIQHILGRYGHGGNSRVFEVKDNVLGISIGDEFYPANGKQY